MDIARMSTATLTNARTVRNHNLHTPWVSWRKTLLLHRWSLVPLWSIYFPAHDLGTGRLKRYPLDSFERTCDQAEDEAAKRRPTNTAIRQARRLLAGDVSLERAWHEINDPQNRPTSQATVEAIWHCVRERGLRALDEPVNRQRLSECDRAAQAELQRRLEKLRASK
jgi:hypothetical protein